MILSYLILSVLDGVSSVRGQAVALIHNSGQRYFPPLQLCANSCLVCEETHHYPYRPLHVLPTELQEDDVTRKSPDPLPCN